MLKFENDRQAGSKARSATLGIVAGALILSAALGVRQTFGLFVEEFSLGHGLPIAQVAFAIALHNLVWGVAQPFAGALADRYGAAPVVLFGAIAFAIGLTLPALAPSEGMLVLGMGFLVGIGISCTSFGVVMTAVGRGAPAERRSMAMGIAGAGGSLGQVLLVPLAQLTSSLMGTAAALLVLAACILAVAPFGFFLDRKVDQTALRQEPPAVPLRTALAQALQHNGYCLLTLGFFTCGFQLAFIATHLPAYLTLCNMPTGVSATALAMIGLFNMIGSWACGWLGGRYPQQHVLGWLYLIRGAAIAAFFLAPKDEVTVLLFAAIMGLTWLGTVPLTSGLVAKVFGTRHLGTLFGICFLSHQVGSFLGAWAGGYAYALTGSYTAIWVATAAAGFLAALLHFPIKDRPAGDTLATPA